MAQGGGGGLQILVFEYFQENPLFLTLEAIFTENRVFGLF